ncbi:adenine nucleotide alpha hydrolase family protein [Pantoea dispersa]
MTCYTHALILVNDKDDGTLLLKRAVALAQPLGMKITLAHISDDVRAPTDKHRQRAHQKEAQEALKSHSFR